MTRSKVSLRVFTHSERRTWQSCHALHGYAYLERLRPDRVTAWQRGGTLYHRAVGLALERVHDELGDRVRVDWHEATEMAVGFADLDARASLEAQRELVNGDADLADELQDLAEWLPYACAHYFEATYRDWDEYALLGVELPFNVPIRDSLGRELPHVRHEGVIDMLALHRPTGRVAVMDHKSMATFGGYERRLQLDDQTTGYLYAAREMWRAKALPYSLEASSITEDSFSMVVHNLARKSAPATPRVNKLKKGDCPDPGIFERLKAAEDAQLGNQGRVSSAAIDTTPDAYVRALSQQERGRGIPVDEDQQARLDQLRARGDAYFKRVECVRTARDLERWCADYVIEQRRMREAEADERLRTPNRGHCTGMAAPSCAYQVLCEVGAPASTRQGKVFGFVRVDDPHEEVRRGEADWKERQGRRQRQGQREGEAEGRLEAARARERGAAILRGEDQPGGAPVGGAQAQAPQAGGRRAEGEGERGEPPRCGGAAPHHNFF